MVEYVKGDITTARTDFILHGCNCRGVMGSGVAAAIRSNFPDAYKQYMKQHKDFGLTLGQFSVSYATKPAIVNLLTQEDFGSDGKIYADKYAIDRSIRNFYQSLPTIRGWYTFAFPQIGCGLGGLSWENDVKPILETLEKELKVKIWVYEL